LNQTSMYHHRRWAPRPAAFLTYCRNTICQKLIVVAATPVHLVAAAGQAKGDDLCVALFPNVMVVDIFRCGVGGDRGVKLTDKNSQTIMPIPGRRTLLATTTTTRPPKRGFPRFGCKASLFQNGHGAAPSTISQSMEAYKRQSQRAERGDYLSAGGSCSPVGRVRPRCFFLRTRADPLVHPSLSAASRMGMSQFQRANLRITGNPSL